MKTAEIKYGGTLQIGDFIGVGSNYSMYFGWFCGRGRADTIQFITPRCILRARESLIVRQETAKRLGRSLKGADSKGLTFEHFPKDHVKTQNFSRIVRIHNPSFIFQDRDEEEYNEAKKILEELKFL